jgi:hypothetical protein
LVWAAISVQVSVSGFQISAGSTAVLMSTPSEREVPPVTMLVPSGSAVIVSNERGWCIGAVSRQTGDGWFMSITAVRPVTVRPAKDGSDHVPDFITFPGAYMTALDPSNGLTGPLDIVPSPETSSRCVWGSGPASKTRPSGSTNMNGYSGVVSRALVRRW